MYCEDCDRKGVTVDFVSVCNRCAAIQAAGSRARLVSSDIRRLAVRSEESKVSAAVSPDSSNGLLYGAVGYMLGACNRNPDDPQGPREEFIGNGGESGGGGASGSYDSGSSFDSSSSSDSGGGGGGE